MWFLLTTALANPALTGRWKLDLEASEPVEPILQAQGFSWLERTIAANARPEQTITWTEPHATIVIRSGPYTRTDELPLDGTPVAMNLTRVGEVVMRSSMKDQGIFTSATLALEEGPATLETQRKLHADGTLRLTMTLIAKSGTTRVERVFRRRD